MSSWTRRPPPDFGELEAILNRVPFGVVAVSRDLSVVRANTAARRFFHPASLRRGEALPAAPFDPALLELAAALFDDGGRQFEREVLVGGRALSVVGIPPGHGPFALLVVQDVGAHSRRERARQEFVANAAHELLTPLTGIVGAAHALESGAKDVPDVRDRFIRHITHECARLARVARGLLVLARARSGEEPPRPDAIPVAQLLDEVLDLLDETDEIEVTCAGAISVFVDRDLAEQALVNLVANAQRYSSGRTVRIDVAPTNHRNVSIDVVNAGAGMTAEELERMHRRFASGGGRDGGGFGLGVSIAQQAVEALGGTLRFESAAGEGTRAHVELPAA